MGKTNQMKSIETFPGLSRRSVGGRLRFLPRISALRSSSVFELFRLNIDFRGRASFSGFGANAISAFFTTQTNFGHKKKTIDL